MSLLRRDYTYVEEVVESKSEKKIRIFLAVMFFLQTVATTLPFLWGLLDEANNTYGTVSALQMLIQPNGYSTSGERFMALFGAIVIILPIVAFFFCVLDKKSKIKYIFTALCSVGCAVMICFFMPVKGNISLGGILTLLINLVTLFMTTQGVMATSIRRREDNES